MSEVKLSHKAAQSTKEPKVKGSSKSNTPEEATKRINELRVTKAELASMKKGGNVYKQLPNSGIFFKQDMQQTMAEASQELHDLIQEYKDAETPGGISHTLGAE